MKRRLFFVFAMVLAAQLSQGQTVKTGVLVIGNGNNAIGAGFQSAISGVKTVLLLQAPEYSLSAMDKNLASGLELRLLDKIREARGIKDPAAAVYVDGTSANAILKSWGDSLKNLTVVRNTKWSRIKRSGNNWNVLLADGRTIKAEVLLNADASGNVDAAIPLTGKGAETWQSLSYNDNLYRNSVAAGYAKSSNTAQFVQLYNLLLPGQENLVQLNRADESMAGGQAAGATAAYAAFFKTKTSLSNLKAIQRELITYKLSVMPFADVPVADSNWQAIQLVGLSGFLKAEIADGRARFMPDKPVTTAEVKEPVKEFYYKAQIWFDDYKPADMTLGGVLDLVCRVGNKSLETTREEVKKKWEKTYHFKTEFDESRVASRREFAVLVNEYLNPFVVNTDKTGRVLR